MTEGLTTKTKTILRRISMSEPFSLPCWGRGTAPGFPEASVDELWGIAMPVDEVDFGRWEKTNGQFLQNISLYGFGIGDSSGQTLRLRIAVLRLRMTWRQCLFPPVGEGLAPPESSSTIDNANSHFSFFGFDSRKQFCFPNRTRIGY